MMRFILVLLMCVLAAPAMAADFVWQDNESGLSLVFPDDWGQVSGQMPGDVFTVVAPGANNFASCRLNVSDDRRFVIYPRRFDAAIQRVAVSDAFWQDYMGHYSGAILQRVRDGQGLANGVGSRADMVFIDETGGVKVLKRGFAFASLYQGEVTVFECSSDYHVL